MGAVYADICDIVAIGRSLTNQQNEAAAVLLEQASAKLRLTAKKFGKDIDVLIAADEDFALAVKAVIVQAVCRALDNMGSSINVQQGTESIGVYSRTMTYLNAGQSLYFLRNELKELGLMRQRYGMLDVFGLNDSEEE